MRALRAIVCLAACVAFALDAAAQEPTYPELLRAFEKQVQDTARTAGPSIACVVVSRSEFYPKTPGAEGVPGKLGDFDRVEFVKNDLSIERAKLAESLDLRNPKGIPDHGYAGGVVIDAAGYVLTPYHVIDGARRVYVFLPGGDGSYADIHAADARSDLAVLKLLKPPAKMTAIKFGNVRTFPTRDQKPTVSTGKLVVLMANPYSSTFGLAQPSAAFGSITNIRRRPVERDAQARAGRYPEYGTLLEYDVKPNAGVTGGVLLNLDSEMIGMTNAAAVAFGQEIGPGYAVPTDDNLRRIVDVLRRGEEVEYGFLGVSPLEPRNPNPPAVVVPLPGGAAALAQMRAGDTITKVNGVPIASFNDLQWHIGSALAGSKVTVAVERAGRERDLEVTLAKFKNEQPFIASVRPEPVFGLRVDYSSLLAQQLDPRMGNLPPLPTGVCVREVVADSAAAKQFKTLGDTPATSWLVTKVNGVEVTTPAEFYKAAKGQESLKLTLINPSEKNPRERELTLP
jgi:serine protease Do